MRVSALHQLAPRRELPIGRVLAQAGGGAARWLGIDKGVAVHLAVAHSSSPLVSGRIQVLCCDGHGGGGAR